jgi:hypothetical protein
MLHLIDKAEKFGTAKEIGTKSTITTTAAATAAPSPSSSWMQLSPSLSRTRKNSIVDELLNGDLLFLDDELLLSEDNDIESLSDTAVAVASNRVSLIESHTTTAVSTEQSSKMSLADSDLHEIEDIISIVNDENLLDDLLVSDDPVNESNDNNENEQDTNSLLLDNIDFSEWSDEGDIKSVDNELFDESTVDQHKVGELLVDYNSILSLIYLAY